MWVRTARNCVCVTESVSHSCSSSYALYVDGDLLHETLLLLCYTLSMWCWLSTRFFASRVSLCILRCVDVCFHKRLEVSTLFASTHRVRICGRAVRCVCVCQHDTATAVAVSAVASAAVAVYFPFQLNRNENSVRSRLHIESVVQWVWPWSKLKTNWLCRCNTLVFPFKIKTFEAIARETIYSFINNNNNHNHHINNTESKSIFPEIPSNIVQNKNSRKIKKK